MRLFQRQRTISPRQQARIHHEVRSIHQFFNDRVSMPFKLRQYEAKVALMRVDGFTEEKAAETIAQWHSAYQKRKRQRMMQQKLARQASQARLTKVSESTAAGPENTSEPFHEPTTEVRRIRRAVREESRTLLALPVEEKLRMCGLISQHQLEIARMEQLTRRNGCSAIDILMEKDWVGELTVRFFDAVLPHLASQSNSRPMESYLQQAGLLTPKQVASLSQTRQFTGKSVLKEAEERGWINRQTIYFINACLNG